MSGQYSLRCKYLDLPSDRILKRAEGKYGSRSNMMCFDSFTDGITYPNLSFQSACAGIQ